MTPSLLRAVSLMLLVLALAAPLAACGKKGPPTVPEGQEDRYPRSYPSR